MYVLTLPSLKIARLTWRLATTWDLVSQTFPAAVAATFPASSGPPARYEDLVWLAGLPSVAGSLALNTKKKGKGPKQQIVEREFKVPSATDASRQRRNIKAALAQAAGVVAAVPCGHCAAGRGVFKICSVAPSRGAQPLFDGCPSCIYDQHACPRPAAAASSSALAPAPAPATAPAAAADARIQRWLDMTEEDWEEEKRLMKRAEDMRAARAQPEPPSPPAPAVLLRSFTAMNEAVEEEGDDDVDMDMDELSGYLDDQFEAVE